jgi:hypothetical protein
MPFSPERRAKLLRLIPGGDRGSRCVGRVIDLSDDPRDPGRAANRGPITTNVRPRSLERLDRTLEEDGAIGVIPIENSVAGTVHLVQDLLIRQPVWIEHEVQVPVTFKLLVRGEQSRSFIVAQGKEVDGPLRPPAN